MDQEAIAEYLEVLGKKGKDKISGIEGRISSIVFDLYGCVQVSLSQKVNSEGKVPDGYWMDFNRIEITDHERVLPLPEFAALPGPADKAPPGV